MVRATRHSTTIKALRERVYQALLDPQLIPRWRVPHGMQCEVHDFDPREGGAFRVSLHYEGSSTNGKTTRRTDTYSGYFERLVPGEQVIERLPFETTDPLMQGEMRIVTDLASEGDRTRVTAVHEGLPPGVAAGDNEAGWRESLGKLATLLETGC